MNENRYKAAYLSELATDMALMPFAGLDVYHEPSVPYNWVNPKRNGSCNERALTELPAAIVTIFPMAAILLATTELEDSDQPSGLPRDRDKISCPSLTPFRSASTMTLGSP